MKKALIFMQLFLAVAVVSSCNNGKTTLPENKEPVTEDSNPAENNQPAAEATATDLPNLPITKLNGTQLLTNNLTGKTILYFFQPDCDHCQRETAEIRDNLSAFRDYQVYFITNYPKPELAKFAQDYKLAFEPNFVFAQATIEDILNTVGPMESPSMFVYSADGRLVKSFKGETPIAQILPVL